MKTPMHPELIAEIRALCADIGMPISYFGKEAVNDFSLVPDLEGGRELKRATMEKVRACIEDLKG